jgi:hypothetical protein
MTKEIDTSEEEAVVAEDAVVDIDDDYEEDIISLSDIDFAGKTLEEYEDMFTVTIPSLPCSSIEMGGAIVKLNNAYQVAYNCYNKLLVMCSRAESQYKGEKYRLCDEYISNAKAQGVTKGKLPAIGTIEAIVTNNTKNKKLRNLMATFKKYSAVKEWFQEHKTKLEKSMMVGKELIYLVTSSDRVHNYTQGRGDGIH